MRKTETQQSGSRDKNVCNKQFLFPSKEKAKVFAVVKSIDAVAVEEETSACDENNLKRK
jgi:hypothetical protein